jgi:uncharacterized protein YecE (DUF72 family)
MTSTILHVGTSGYSYKEWKGSFYPKDIAADEMLHFYSQHFTAVEINNSFYRLPKPSVLKTWATQVPPDFKFILKAPQRITHFQRLQNTAASVSEFLRVAKILGPGLGPLLFQLPPNMKKDIPRLAKFLRPLKRHRVALEFRHQSWFDDEVFDLLRDHQAALCLAEADDDLKVPFVSTAPWGYLRLRLPSYTAPDLKRWIKNIRQQKWSDTFVFFKHEDTGTGPKFAKRFLEFAA